MAIFFIHLWIESVIIYSVLVGIASLTGCPLACRCSDYTNSSIYVECFITNSSHDVIFHNTSLPDYTVTVFISVCTYINQMPDAAFQEPSWNQVLHLKLSGNGNIASWRPSVQTFQSLRSVRYLYLRDAGITYIENGSFSELPDLIVLDLSQNKGLQWIVSEEFASITGFQHLEDFDISCTSLTDLHQDSFRYFPSLQILNMAGNVFSGVIPSTFSKLFIWNRNLSHLNISWNKIDSLPSDLLITNRHITVLDLSHNYLQSFSLMFHKDALLQLIDLSYNVLVVFEPVFPDFISVDLPNWHGLKIYIAGNNLQCKHCSHTYLEMIIWMVSSQPSNNVQFSPPNVTCIYEGGMVEILENISSFIKRDCILIKENMSFSYSILPVVIGIFATSCVGLCLMFGVWYCRKKKCKISSPTENQIQLQNNVGINIFSHSQPDYAVFLSFSSSDKDFVIECVWPKMETKLKCLLKKETKLVFVGDANFDVGKQICDEVISAASRCWCTVLIISNSFLESDWCLFEVQSTWNSGCRIFPLFIEKCDGRKAKGIMKVVCRDMVRLLWPNDRADLQEQLFDSLCAQIVQHISLYEKSI